MSHIFKYSGAGAVNVVGAGATGFWGPGAGAAKM